MTAARVILKPGKEHIIGRGHPWLFSGAIARIEGKPANGGVLPVCRADGRVVAQAAYNHLSDIALRILTLDPGVRIDGAFWRAHPQRSRPPHRAGAGIDHCHAAG